MADKIIETKKEIKEEELDKVSGGAGQVTKYRYTCNACSYSWKTVKYEVCCPRCGSDKLTKVRV